MGKRRANRSGVPTIVENSAKCVDNKTLIAPFPRYTVQKPAVNRSVSATSSRWRHAAMLVAVSACSSHHSPGLRVALVTPGSVADAAWNSGAYHGLLRIRDSLGVSISHVEAKTPAEQSEALRAY